MAATYEEHSRPAVHEDAPRQRSLGEHIFIWLAWALAAAFWGATTTVFIGIVEAISDGPPVTESAAGLGGLPWLIGVLVLLGAALAYGSWMYSHRNRRLDPVGEAATAELYDQADRQNGEEIARTSTVRGRIERPV